MSEFWFPWYPSLYKLDTLHLTAEQDGIYRRLIDHYMETARELPDNVAAIARIAGVDASSNALSIVLAFFEHAPSIGYKHKKCDSNLADMYERSVKRHGIAKTAANKRWKKVKEKQKPECLQHASSMLDAMLNDATPTPTDTSKDIICGFEELWVEWNPYEMNKGDKKKAKEAYSKAWREKSDRELLVAAKSYCANCHKLKIKTKHVVTWLNQRGWENETTEEPANDLVSKTTYDNAKILVANPAVDQTIKESSRKIIEKYEAQNG